VILYKLDANILTSVLSVIQGTVYFILTTDIQCHDIKCKRMGSLSARYIFYWALD